MPRPLLPLLSDVLQKSLPRALLRWVCPRKQTNKGRAAVEEFAETAAAAATCPVLAFDDDTAIS